MSDATPPTVAAPRTLSRSNSSAEQLVTKAADVTNLLRMIASGVTILASLALLGFWFWVVIGIMAAASKPEVRNFRDEVVGSGNYFSYDRVVWASIIAVGITVFTWVIAMKSHNQ